MIWAALKSDSHPTGVHQRQVALPLRWLQRFSASNLDHIMRRCRSVPDYFTLLCFDGSPTGGGATLSIAATSRKAPPTFALQLKWTASDAERAKAVIGEAASQHLWEAMALLEALRAWESVWSTSGANIVVVGDAQGVLQDAIRLRAKEPRLNRIFCEAALCLAPHGKSLEALHIWSEDNVTCDRISRAQSETDLPRELRRCRWTNRSAAPYMFL